MITHWTATSATLVLLLVLGACGSGTSSSAPREAATTSPRTAAPRPRPPRTTSDHHAAPGPATHARADLDGDGRRDVVVVHPGGLVVARLSGSGRHSLRLPDDGYRVRLRGLARLVTGQGVDVLAAGTPANGSIGGYDAPVLRVWHGRLGLVRLAGGRLLRVLVSAGDGDLYAGFRCGRDLTLTSGLVPEGRTVREVHVRVRGLTARRTHVDRLVLDDAAARRATAVSCPGIRPGIRPAPRPAGP